MHGSESDRELLGRYSASGEDAPFRVLVDRYSGLVFHTARRTLGDAPLAEDVSQRVFVSLAKKAGQVAHSGSPLPSWLHHATLLEAKAVLRSESRHARKKEALMNAPVDPPDSGDSAWRDALPHLDDAIDALPESDRHVLLLHFVNELTHAEIARRVGRSAAAVQKQSRRALEKLQQILGRKGIALSIGVLTAGLTTEMTKAAPVILAPVLGTSIGETTTSLFAVKKPPSQPSPPPSCSAVCRSPISKPAFRNSKPGLPMPCRLRNSRHDHARRIRAGLPMFPSSSASPAISSRRVRMSHATSARSIMWKACPTTNSSRWLWRRLAAHCPSKIRIPLSVRFSGHSRNGIRNSRSMFC
jgi:RNA polymerase sigma factor (sigma-70 family)